jgi:hypothetical protein
METSTMVATENDPISLGDFLETIPPGRLTNVADIIELEGFDQSIRHYLKTPEIQLHCDSNTCRGLRFFACVSREGKELSRTADNHVFLTYRCRNCQNTEKIFAISARLNEGGNDGLLVKVGEWPPFGPPIPPRVIKLIGPDRELYLMGNRAENQGMGIGSFAYYRRVVENQKNRILEEIVCVAEKVKAPKDLIDKLRAAQRETQFSKAMQTVKDAVPEILLINGHNPLTLLHSALSEGLHAQSDEQCLQLATSIRVVLAELADRIGQVLKDEEELKRAVSLLLKPKSEKKYHRRQ